LASDAPTPRPPEDHVEDAETELLGLLRLLDAVSARDVRDLVGQARAPPRALSLRDSSTAPRAT